MYIFCYLKLRPKALYKIIIIIILLLLLVVVVIVSSYKCLQVYWCKSGFVVLSFFSSLPSKMIGLEKCPGNDLFLCRVGRKIFTNQLR